MNLLYSADNHITLNPPIARTDNFVETLTNLLKWLNTIIEKYSATHISGGDIIDKDMYTSSNRVLAIINFLLSFYPDTIGILGNHDLRYNSLEYLDQSIANTLIHAGVFNHITQPYEIDKNVWLHPFNWGVPIDHIKDLDSYPEESKHIAIMHAYVYQEKTSLITGYNAKQLLYDFPEYDMILTGDHHEKFVVEYEGQVLINSGPLYKGDIKHIDYEPSVWLIHTHDLSYTEIPVPDLNDVISTAHKDKIEHKQLTMDSVIDVINTSKEGGDVINFEEEIDRLKKENKKIMNEEIKVLIEKALEEGEA